MRPKIHEINCLKLKSVVMLAVTGAFYTEVAVYLFLKNFDWFHLQREENIRCGCTNQALQFKTNEGKYAKLFELIILSYFVCLYMYTRNIGCTDKRL